MSTSAVYPLAVTAGTDFSLPFTWEEDGVPQNIQNYIFHYEVRDNARSNPVVLLSGSWMEMNTYQSGQTSLSFTPAQTKQMVRSGYYYILNMTDNTGYVRRILEGPVGVTQ